MTRTSKFSLILALTLVYASSHAQQSCNSSIAETAPASRFTVNDDQTVTDRVTGLIWRRCSEGQSGSDCNTGTATTFTWQDALATASASTFAGQNDWRLPNVKELLSIVEYACFAPAINPTVFPNAPGLNTWSASPQNNVPNDARFVSFRSGLADSGSRDSNFRVRLVRDGQ